jgi:thermostable 8-oxoguanine DNA glycosylase
MKTEIKPERITDYNRTDEELQAFLIFAIAVAGKQANAVSTKVNKMLSSWGTAPFDYLRSNRNKIEDIMRGWKMGPYEKRMVPAMNAIIDMDLRSCTTADLESIMGVGPKTSRFFILHSRPNQEYVVLDVHLLRYLKREFRMKKIPKGTPSGNRYLDIEGKAIEKIKSRYPEMSFADFDLNAWLKMRSKGE